MSLVDSVIALLITLAVAGLTAVPAPGPTAGVETSCVVPDMRPEVGSP